MLYGKKTAKIALDNSGNIRIEKRFYRGEEKDTALVTYEISQKTAGQSEPDAIARGIEMIMADKGRFNLSVAVDRTKQNIDGYYFLKFKFDKLEKVSVIFEDVV